MTSTVPAELRYTKSHEWIKRERDGSVTVGITDHAQHALGDLVFVETPDAGRTLATGEACAVVESVKAASDVYSPLAGLVAAANASLAEAPEKINSDPYGEGWLFRLTPADPGAVDGLLDAGAYARLLEETAE
ncbi:MAG TPA: glycine cleavage system protein GcvH [Steroidobacteraceae bacterium]|nr:glycine cleavage system protein GcvH [Steroidobacteraceae bacterium]